MLIGSVLSVEALNPGTDVLVPAAGRGGSWVTDLYVMNPGDAAVDGSVFWLVRGQANSNPISVPFSLEPGETLVMTDVLKEDFGLNLAFGAFRVTADAEVVVNSRIFSSEGGETFGQGFEGVPVEAATTSGQTSNIVGLSHVDQVFRTNFYALAGAEGASMTLSLHDPNGIPKAAGTLDLEAYMPYLKKINQVLASGDFEEGTLRVTVTAGSVVVGASKVDELSTDPTTLESSTPLGAKASIDGTYEFTLTDTEGFASGGDIVISGGVVQTINGTFGNWDKDSDTNGEADCPLVFRWGLGFPATAVTDMADGVNFTDSYTATGSGEMAWAVEFVVTDGLNISGTVTAAGTEFPSSADPNLDESGCNGAFPVLTLAGGKVD
jgi:hypothetical protein